jgi:hypothetical protein
MDFHVGCDVHKRCVCLLRKRREVKTMTKGQALPGVLGCASPTFDQPFIWHSLNMDRGAHDTTDLKVYCDGNDIRPSLSSRISCEYTKHLSMFERRTFSVAQAKDVKIK